MIALASRRRSLEPRWLGLAIGNHRLPRIVDTLTADSHSSRRHIGTETNHHQYPWRKHKAADEIDELFHVVLLHGDTSVIRCVNGSSCYSFYFIYDAVNMEEVVSTLSVQTVALRAACYPPRRRSCNDGKCVCCVDAFTMNALCVYLWPAPGTPSKRLAVYRRSRQYGFSLQRMGARRYQRRPSF